MATAQQLNAKQQQEQRQQQQQWSPLWSAGLLAGTIYLAAKAVPQVSNFANQLTQGAVNVDEALTKAKDVITHLQGHLKEHPNRLPNSPIPQLETTNEQDDDGGGDNTEQEEEAAPVAKEKERKMIETPEKDETQEKAERRQLRSRAPAAAIPQPAKQKATLLHRPKRRKISMNRYDKAGAAPPHRDDPPRGIKAVDDETAREIAELLWSTEGVEAQEEALDGILWLNPWLKANLVDRPLKPNTLVDLPCVPVPSKKNAKIRARLVLQASSTAEEEYMVQSILKDRVVDGERTYLVVWEGGDKTWEPLEHIDDCAAYAAYQKHVK